VENKKRSEKVGSVSVRYGKIKCIYSTSSRANQTDKDDQAYEDNLTERDDDGLGGRRFGLGGG
jgi:hypothetical protein